MLSQHIANTIFRNLNALAIVPRADNVRFQDTIKQRLIHNAGELHLIDNGNYYNGEINCDSFKEALYNDLKFGITRFNEQRNNVTHLIDKNAQPAWILISAYYASFFACNEISKLMGSFIINFSRDEYSQFLANSAGQVNVAPNGIEDNNSFHVKVSQGDTVNFIKLKFSKCASKPHKVAWSNICSILESQIDHESCALHKDLFLSICDSSNRSGWKLPSTIRNEWNYTYSNYYGDKGSELADVFLSIIKNSGSTMKWANNIQIQPHEKNIVGSIAFIYHTLSDCLTVVNRRLFE